MGKDGGWKTYFNDNRRYADLINGIGCHGKQLVKETDLQEEDVTARDKSRDIVRKVAFGTRFVIVGIENQEEKDYSLPLRNMFYDVSNYEKQASKIRKEVRKESNENTDVFQTDIKQVFDFIRYSDDMNKLLELVENDVYYSEMDEDAFEVVTKYTNSKELVQAKEYTVEGGKNDVCKAIQDLMADSKEKGREEGRESALVEAAKNLLDILTDEVIAENIGLPLEKVQELRLKN